MVAVLRRVRGELLGTGAQDTVHRAASGSPPASRADALVALLRSELERLAEAADSGPASALDMALDGAELVMRRELERGGEAELAGHLSSFAFLVVLPGLGRERAAAVSERVEQLLA